MFEMPNFGHLKMSLGKIKNSKMSRTYGSGFVQVNIFDTGFTSKSATPPSKLNLLSGLETRLKVVCSSEGSRARRMGHVG